MRRHLPDDARQVGLLIGVDDMEYSLWRPLGQRRVRDCSEDDFRAGKHSDLQWLVVKTGALRQNDPPAVAAFVAAVGGVVVARETLTAKVSVGPEEWLVIRLGKRENSAR